MFFPRPIKRINGCIAYALIIWDGRGYTTHFATDNVYRKIWYEEKRWSCHRLSYHLNIEEIPRLSGSMADGHILHDCDKKWCIDPNHLYLGTAHDNAVDRWTRKPCSVVLKQCYGPEVY